MNLDNTSQIESLQAVAATLPAQMLRNDWSRSELKALYDLPMNDLLFNAHSIHRQNFEPNQVQTSTLMSIKTGACPEDCAYCPQSGHHNTGLSKEQLVALEEAVTFRKS